MMTFYQMNFFFTNQHMNIYLPSLLFKKVHSQSQADPARHRIVNNSVNKKSKLW